ncbi:MAG: C4-type zinc ribbon domain-containing protein [Trueperaceae bacterium]|jgi:predicted  nucleic acid-binding Zn-ribbon protein|nr:C4-type zinc ribbon domain-containing protein [Truepera sp.]HRN18786.1 C4-type zinc ribbon domain-containing protein [Trueperaceae bacterium]HRQ09546.1 C4-type zinc ribbon domain-containing protein [Trueperaceae bacterium]
MLNRLAEVQTFDLKLDALREDRGQVPHELVATDAKKRRLEQLMALKEQDRDVLRKRVNSNELELKTLQERRRAAADSAVRASTSKEASQFQNQELQFATRISELEEDTMPLLESQEALEQELAALRDELDALVPELEALRKAEDDRVAAVDAQSASVKAEREALAREITPSLLKQYEQVRKARRGVGLAEVIGNSTCSGCNVRLPIFVVQQVRRGEGVTRCPSCGRILYHKQED